MDTIHDCSGVFLVCIEYTKNIGRLDKSGNY